MTFTKTLSILFSLLFSLHLPSTNAATFNITNRCSYTVWAAASPGGGRRLDNDQTWQINVAPGTTQARIWGWTNCSFDANGHGQCQTGDCNGLLECQGYGSPPDTLAEFALNQPNNLDYFDISLVDGFNVPLEFAPTTNMCRGVHCIGPILEQCPTELRTPGGCNNPCTVFPTNEYCCYEGPGSCVPTAFSRFFRERCPDAYNFPQDGRNTLFTCPSGTNYRVTFCP